MIRIPFRRRRRAPIEVPYYRQPLPEGVWDEPEQFTDPTGSCPCYFCTRQRGADIDLAQAQTEAADARHIVERLERAVFLALGEIETGHNHEAEIRLRDALERNRR